MEISGDEHILFALPFLNHNRRPAVTLGKSPKTGKLQLHFRVYRRDGRVKTSKFDMTAQGCTISLGEFDQLVQKIDELTTILPEVAAERRKAS